MNRFLKEIEELPGALLNLIGFYRSKGRDRLNTWAAWMSRRHRVVFSGMGTSEFSPLAVRPRMAAVGVVCHTVDAGELLHYPIPLSDAQTLVVLISQSGESVEIRRLIEQGMEGDGYIAITNDERSTLAQGAALVLPLCAGEEAAITTKTYTNTLALLTLMAAALEGQSALDGAFDHLTIISDYLCLVDSAEISMAGHSLSSCDALGFIARGPAIASARQGALTFMEGAKCPTAAFTGGAFRHGPFEAVGPDLGLVVFAPEGRTRVINESLAREAARFGAHVVLLTDAAVTAQEDLTTIKVRNLQGPSSEDLFPLAASGVLPRLLGAFAMARGITEDELGTFRFGGKVTLRE